jgi:hypothetical protein
MITLIKNKKTLEVLLASFYTILFILLILKIKSFQIDGLHKLCIPGIFIIKVLFGILIFLVYTHYYSDRSTADIFKYFDDGKILYNIFYESPLHFIQLMLGLHDNTGIYHEYLERMSFWFKPYDTSIYNGNRIIIRFNALFMFLSFGYYQVHNIFMNFISIIGLTFLYKGINFVLPNRKILIFIAVFLIPSILFWGSGVLKEGIILFSLGVTLFNLFHILHQGFSIKRIGITIVAFSLLILTKVYVGICLLPSILAYAWITQSNRNYPLLKYIAVYILFLIISLGLQKYTPNRSPLDFISNRQVEFTRHVITLKSGSIIELPSIEPNLISILTNIPEAIAITTLRPYPIESTNAFYILCSIENYTLIIVLLIVLFYYKRKDVNFNLLLFCLSFGLSLYALIGLTTPVIGSIVRYKVPGLLFISIGIITLTNKDLNLFKHIQLIHKYKSKR